ncbi:MAG TPA: hypothetical protein VE869_13420 [Gemmatimonas sp.]|nr:hypothetical protein [Gemmatimonas sp.]
MKSRLCTLMIAALASSAACSSTTAPAGGDGVTAVYVNERVAVTNRRDAPVFTFVIGRNAAAVTDWIPCVQDALCPPIHPGTSQRINPLISLGGETEVLVYWWQRTFGPEGGQADSIRNFVVKLPRPM